LERLSELRVYLKEWEGKSIGGWNTVLVTEKTQPYMDKYWPSGHIIGWEHTFINEIHYFLKAVVQDEDIAPLGATFEDGYRNNVIMDAILKSAENGKRVVLSF